MLRSDEIEPVVTCFSIVNFGYQVFGLAAFVIFPLLT
jgi:hypothetical protein